LVLLLKLMQKRQMCNRASPQSLSIIVMALVVVILDLALMVGTQVMSLQRMSLATRLSVAAMEVSKNSYVE
jgi:hypothetical protein